MDDQETQLIYPLHAQNNANTLANIKFLSSCFIGAVAGVLGLENQYGFALFAAASLITAALVYLVHVAGGATTPIPLRNGKKNNADGAIRAFVRGGVWELVNPGQENVFSFVLLWTLFYGTVNPSSRPIVTGVADASLPPSRYCPR